MQSQKEPFFKPLKPDHQSLDNRSKQINDEHTRLDQDYAINGERLTSLHAKLHLEADKIRKWKNQTELDLKQKDRKIQEASQTIDTLRKSLLDVQLHNESLTMNLQEEIANREDMLQRVAATRHLCSVLKDHLARAENRLDSCEKVKTDVQMLEQEHLAQFQSLSEQFKGLQTDSTEKHAKLMEQLTTATNDNVKLKDELQHQSEQAETQLKVLQNNLDEKDIEIRDIRAQVHRNEETIHEKEKHIDNLTNQEKQLQEQLDTSDCKNKSLLQEINCLKDSKSEVEETLKNKTHLTEELGAKNVDLQTELSSITQQHAHQIDQLQKDMEQLQIELAKKQKKLESLEISLEKTSTLLEDVKSSKDMLIIEKTELEKRVRELEQQNVHLLGQHEENCQTMSQMCATVTDLQNQLAVSKQEGASLLLQLNELRTQLQMTESEKSKLDEQMKLIQSDVHLKETCIMDLQRELTEKSQLVEQLTQQINILQTTVEREKISHEETKLILAECQSELSCSKNMLAKHVKEMEKMRMELESVQSKYMEGIEEFKKTESLLRKETETLSSELVDEKDKNKSLLQRLQQNDENLQGKLQSKEKAASDLEVKNKTLKSDLTRKNKQIKELERELKSLKKDITSRTKSVEGKEQELARLESKLESKLLEKEQYEIRLEQTEDNMAKLRESKEEAEQQASEMKSLADKCVAEKEAAILDCEAQKTRMMTIMENYKSDNDKNLATKVEEVKTLKRKLENLESKQNSRESEQVTMLQKEVEQLRRAISESGYQMENLQKTYGEKEDKLQKLQQENQKKDEELKDLQSQLEKMFIKNSANTVVQTSTVPERPAHQLASKIPTPKLPPRTPQVNKSDREDTFKKTPNIPRTPQVAPKTPSSAVPTPQRSILKDMSTHSVTKKRRVVFATQGEEDMMSNSGESCTFELMELEDEKQTSKSTSRIILVQSPKTQTPDLSKARKSPVLPVNKLPREKPMDQDKKKAKEKGTSSVRKAPQKSAGKFFKTGLKSKMESFREKEKDLSWFESDDVFGFANED